MPEEPSELQTKLQDADPQVKLYIVELQKENARLQTQIAKYEVKQMSLNNRIKALEKEIEESKPKFDLIINLGDDSLPGPELEAKMIKRLEELGYRVEKIAT